MKKNMFFIQLLQTLGEQLPLLAPFITAIAVKSGETVVEKVNEDLYKATKSIVQKNKTQELVLLEKAVAGETLTETEQKNLEDTLTTVFKSEENQFIKNRIC